MAIFKILDDELQSVSPTTFAQENIRERDDLQRLLKKKIEIISPNTLVISEEFGEWDESKQRIDLLGIDRDANIVVIELKRTEDGGHMELQAIRYASMVSVLTFERAVDIFKNYIEMNNLDYTARDKLLSFLEWDEPDQEKFAQEARIVLASAEFSKEITTSVIWLNEQGLNIRCIRLKPYVDGDNVLLDVQQVIPLPEAEEYQIQIHEKQQREKVARNNSKDRSIYTILFNGNIEIENIRKSDIGYKTVEILESNIEFNEEVFNFLRDDRSCNFQLLKKLDEVTDNESKYGKYRVNREPEILYNDIGYYVARNWGVDNVPKFIKKFTTKFPGLEYKIRKN